MNQVFLSDKEVRDNLFPFTLMRSAADIRIGILTIREKWQAYLKTDIIVTNNDSVISDNGTILSANIIPSKQFIHSLFDANGKLSDNPAWNSVKILQYPWHIFMWNDWALREDFKLITENRKSEAIPSSVHASAPENIFIEPGARLSHCIINAEGGPVYIGKNAEVMEGSIIRGPVAVCEGAVIKMGARIYPATTIGPYCIAGGEIKNSVMFGYSNKAHDGYLGDSVIAEWCNLGAGTSNSNVKNNAAEIKVWNNTSKELINTGLNKCGLMMGDYSRAAINTSFNTGTMVGVCANIFGPGLTPNFIPSFNWGNKRYQFENALADIGNWKKLKNAVLDEQEKMRLKLIFDSN